MDEMKRQCRIGGGGWKCHCCGPKTADRPAVRRSARRRMKLADKAAVEHIAQELP